MTTFPAGTFEAIATYADQISTFTVTAERRGEPEGDTRSPWIPRWVTIRIDDTVWSGARAADPTTGVGAEVGETLDVLTWPRDRDDDCVGVEPDGNPTLLPGRRYVGAVYHSADGWELFPGSSGVVDLDGRLAVRSQFLDGLTGPADYGARVGAVPVPSDYADLMLLDPMDRFEALMTRSQSEPVLPSAP